MQSARSTHSSIKAIALVLLFAPAAAAETIHTRTVTAAMPTTGSTIIDPFWCDLTFRVTTRAVFSALQFDIDYSRAWFTILGSGGSAECRFKAGDLRAINDDDSAGVLHAAVVSHDGFSGPTDVLTCSIMAFDLGSFAEITIRALDATTPTLEPIAGAEIIPEESCRFGSTTVPVSNTVPPIDPPACGTPATGAPQPSTTDALYVLRTAIGLETCEPCECDVNGSGAVTVTDARRALLAASGQAVALVCPRC